MPLRFIRIIAVALIVLGASPVTAPFSTCDWRTLTGHDQSALPSDDAGPHGVLAKTSSDPDNAPVVAVTEAMTTPLFNLVANDSAVLAAHVLSRRLRLLSLRI
jgi:hypothetical protein